MPLSMRNLSRLDFLIKHIFLLVLPLLLFTTASMISYTSSNSLPTAFQSGLCGFFVGSLITIILHKFITLTVYETPRYLLYITYFTYALSFYVLLQGIPFLVLLTGIFAGMYFRRSYSLLNISTEEYNYKVFQISFFTAVIIGFLSLFSSYLILFNITDLRFLDEVEAVIRSIPKPIAALILFTSCVIISHLQFLLTKMTLLIHRKR